jgi:acetyl esterase/lipase
MKYVLPIALFLYISICSLGQDIVELPFETPQDITWNGGEKDYYSDIWSNRVVTNVSTPTMMVFRPDADKANDAAVVIAPGGGLYALSIESEGTMVAEWLNGKGITAFVLKYRLVPTGEDGVAEITKVSQDDIPTFVRNVGKVMPFSVADGLAAISYVRKNAKSLGVDPEKIGFMGFSAGGAVTMGVAYHSNQDNKPDFLVPVYAWVDAMPIQEPAEDAPPMLIVCASDDPLGLAKGSIDLYNSWYNKQLNVGMHMYSRGGHGFGMKKGGTASDKWIERFYEWMLTEGLVKK